jgi:glycosyltransferase involved in cell wall biosynthesis
VFLNHVDSSIFYRRPRRKEDATIILIFAGSFQWHQGLDLAIEALAHLKDRFPNAELHLYRGGGGASLEVHLAQLAERLGIKDRVRFFGSVPLDQIPDVIAKANLGVVPKRADSFGNEAYSTKIMELMSQGIPAIVSRTKIDTFYFTDRMVQFFPSGDSRAMADVIATVLENPTLQKSLAKEGLEYVRRNSWDGRKIEYLDLVDFLSTEMFGDAPAGSKHQSTWVSPFAN